MKHERVWIWLARLLPRPLVYWAALRVGAEATTGAAPSWHAPDLKFMDALKRWER